MAKWENYLKRVYYDAKYPGSMSSIDKFYKAVKDAGKIKVSRAKVARWLRSQDAYTLHRGVRRKFKRNKVIVPEIDYQWDIDLADMRIYAKENDGYSYFLAVIDIFSRYALTRKLKSKTSGEVAKAFKSILDERGSSPMKARSDKGQEFNGKAFQNLMQKEGIDHFVTQNEPKANYCERLLKTLKNKIAKQMTKRRNHKWIDILAGITTSYNKTYHRSIKRAPIKVTQSDEYDIWKMQYEPRLQPKKLPERTKKSAKVSKEKSPYKFKIGDMVRISHLRQPFQREYDERWTTETFLVIDRFTKTGIAHYRLKDTQNEAISGSFYNSELQKVHIDGKKTRFIIDQVLKKRTRKGKSESFVSWKGFPSKFSSWILTSQIKTYKN